MSRIIYENLAVSDKITSLDRYPDFTKISLNNSKKIFLLSFLDVKNGASSTEFSTWIQNLINIYTYFNQPLETPNPIDSIQVLAIAYDSSNGTASNIFNQVDAIYNQTTPPPFPTLGTVDIVIDSGNTYSNLYSGIFTDTVVKPFHYILINTAIGTGTYRVVDKFHMSSPNSGGGDTQHSDLSPIDSKDLIIFKKLNTGTHILDPWSPTNTDIENYAIKRITEHLNDSPVMTVNIPSGSYINNNTKIVATFSKKGIGVWDYTKYSIKDAALVERMGSVDYTQFSDGSTNFPNYTVENFLAGVKEKATLSLAAIPASTTVTVTNNGTTDSDGTSINFGTINYNVDITPPSFSKFALSTGSPNPTSNPNISFDLTATDNVGVTAWLVNESSTPPSASGGGWTTVTSITPLTITGGTYSLSGGLGTKHVYAWAKDAAGNVSAVNVNSHFDVVFDSELPQTTAFTRSSASPTKNPVVSFHLEGSDNIGIVQWKVTENNTKPSSGSSGWTIVAETTSLSINGTYTLTSPSTSRTQTLYVWLGDGAGNVSDENGTSHFDVVYDVTVPVVTAFTLTSANPTNNQTITFNLEANDPV